MQLLFNVDDIKIFDGVSLNISEDNADPGLDIRFNFTGVSDFNQLIMRFKTDAGSDHKTSIQLWDFVNSVWEDHDYYIETTIWDNPYVPIWDSNSHIGTGANEGEVWVRIYLDDMGKLAHTHYYDFVQLSKGLGTYSSIESDPLSYHKNEDIQFNSYNFNGSGNYTSTGKATIYGESVFGKTVDSLTNDDDFDNGLEDYWDAQGDWYSGSDAGDYYVSISAWNSYVSQMSIGGTRTCEFDFGGKTGQKLKGDGGKKTDIIYITATTTDGLKLWSEEDDAPTKYYKAKVTLMNTVEIADLNVLNTEFVSLKSSTATGITGEEASSLGHETMASGQYSFAINEGCNASGMNSFAGGDSSTASGNEAFAFGDRCEALSSGAIAMGNQAEASGSNSISLGVESEALDGGSVAIGSSSSSSGGSATAIGRQAEANAVYATGVGYKAIADNSGSLALGSTVTASGDYAIVIGKSITNSIANSLAVGWDSVSFEFDSTSLKFKKDNQNLIFGVGEDLKIGSDGDFPVYNATGVHTFYNATGLGTVRAGRYITGSYVPEISSANFLSKLDNINEWTKEDKSIDYSKHYAYVQTLEKDPTHCWNETDYYCWNETENNLTEKNCGEVLPKEIKASGDFEIIYREECGTRLADGLDLEKRAGDMEAMIYELKQENDLLKSELCKKDITYSWC